MLRQVQVGPVDAGEVEQTAEIEWRRQVVHLLLRDVELTHEQAQGHLVHVFGDLEPDGRAEPASKQLLLECLDEVFGLVFVDLDVFIASDSKDVVLDDLHSGEEVAQVVGDEVFQGNKTNPIDGLVSVDAHEAWKHRRNLEPSELLLAGLGVANAHREIEGEPGDVGERMRRVNRERHQHRENLI